MRAVVRALSMLLAVTCLAGCLAVHPRHRGPPHVPPGHRRVPPGHLKKVHHVHGTHCGHVFRDGRWVEVEVHVGH